MKKTLIVILLAMVVVSSMVCGTFAVYSTNEEITSGDLLAKTMILKLNKINGFDDSLDIAPTESCQYIFNVTNTAGNAVTKVPVNATITVSVQAADGKQPIGNLTAELYEDGIKIADIQLNEGVGSVELNRYFGLTAKTLEYTLVISWPSRPNDNDYIGNEFGNVVYVNASGVQATEESEEPDTSVIGDIGDYLFEHRYEIFVSNKEFSIFYDTDDGVYYTSGRDVYWSAYNLENAMTQFLDDLGEDEVIYIYCHQSSSGNLRILIYTESYPDAPYYDKTVDRFGNVSHEDINLG